MTQDKHEEQISELLTTLSAKTSFTAKALEQFNEAIKRVASLESTNEYLRGTQTDLEDRIEEKGRNETQQLQKLEVWEAREDELKKREDEIRATTRRMDVAEAKSEVFKSVFTTIFANTTVRKNVAGQIPMFVEGITGGGGVQPQQGYHTSEQVNVEQTETEE